MIRIRFVLALFVMIMMTGQGMAADVKVFPPGYLANEGGTFDLNITIDPQGAAIAGAQLNIVFDQTKIRINKITEGNLFKQNGASTFFAYGIINNSTGSVINIFGVVIGRTNVSNPGTFININATVIGSSGTSGINLSNVKISNSDAQPVPLVVYNASMTINGPPVLDTIGNRIIEEGQALTFTLSATDINGDALTYSAINLPSGAVFVPANRTFLWTPDFTQSGNYPDIHFEVSDGSVTDSENVTITVNNFNRAPTFTSYPGNGSTFNETEIIPISIIANDPDNDTLSYIIRLDGKLVSTTANFKWITNSSSSGNHNIEITVNDGTVSVTRTTMVYIATLPVKASINIIKNPGFESGKSSWTFYSNGKGTFGTASGYEGNNSARLNLISIVSPANIQLYQKGITLEPKTLYRLSFAAYSTTGHDLSVSIQKHDSPYTNYGLSNYVANLGTSWSKYSVQFTTSGFSGNVTDARLMFWLAGFAAAGDNYYIDDIRLEKI